MLTSIAGLALSGATTSAHANDVAPAVAAVALVHSADAAGLDLSAQRRGGGGGARPAVRMVRPSGGGVGRVGNVGRVGRVGNVGRIGNVSRVGRVSRIDGISRVGRIERIGRINRIERIGRINRIERIGRVGRIGYRYGRIGYVPVPVPLEPGPGGGVAPQGVQGAAPPCPVCPVQACIVSVFSEPNLTGTSTETADNQPRLDLNGWQNQISSIMVKSGTWDFYPDLEFRGAPPLRLAPGSYGILEPQWTKRIGSFMCVR
jgi:hypothetical protein